MLFVFHSVNKLFLSSHYKPGAEDVAKGSSRSLPSQSLLMSGEEGH